MMIARVAIAALLSTIAVAGVQTWRLDSLQKEVEYERQQRAEAERMAERAASAKTTRTDRAYQARRETARAVDAAAAAAADRVRNDIAARADSLPHTAGCAAVEAERDRLASLVSRSADLAARCQRVGQQLADEVTELQGLVQ